LLHAQLRKYGGDVGVGQGARSQEALLMAEDKSPDKMTIIAFSGDLDKLWPTMILSSTGAASGLDVTVFHTFWGLFPLVRDDVRVTGDNAMTKMLAGMNPPGFRRAKLSKLNMGGAGKWMMRRLAGQHNVMPPEDLFDMCLDMGVKIWPCQMTMDLLGIRPDQLRPGLGEPAGAATALSEMSRSKIQLFI
jgi:peroxiredoxin family protein